MTGFKTVETKVRLSFFFSRGMARYVWIDESFFGLPSCAVRLVLLSEKMRYVCLVLITQRQSTIFLELVSVRERYLGRRWFLRRRISQRRVLIHFKDQ